MYEGTDREHTCDRLIPGHTYRVRVAACSIGGRSDVSLSPSLFNIQSLIVVFEQICICKTQ